MGTVDYSLAKRWLLSRLERGAMGTADVCDAHPELLRAARSVGEAMDDECPICSTRLRTVRYVFGDSLGRLNGRVAHPLSMMQELETRHDEFRSYSVEVCTECHWNHVRFCGMHGRQHARSKRSGSAGNA